MTRKIVVLCALLAWALLGHAGDTALDRSGNLYHVVPASNQGLPFLQLDIYAPDGSRNSLPVWGTKSLAKLSNPQVVFSQPANRLYIVFSQGSGAFTDVVLTSYSPRDGLSLPYSLSTDHQNRSAVNPRVVLTSEVTLNESGQKVWFQLLHLLWWEDGSRPGAVYANLPVNLHFDGIDDLTRIQLTDLLTPGMEPADLGPLAPHAYQHPRLFPLAPLSNAVRAIFFNPAILQYQIADLTYNVDSETMDDRAHFPDIGLKASLPFPPEFAPTQSVSTILSSTGNVAMFSVEPEGISYTYYCQQWTAPSLLPLILPEQEVENMLSAIIEEPE